MRLSYIGLDTAKNVFQVHGVDERDVLRTEMWERQRVMVCLDYGVVRTPSSRPTNAACPAMSSFGNHLTCPLRIIFTVSIPWSVRHAE